ncbi:hypothetical protein P692DRAFT_20751994 [Suillus brevipes Sb2]|nr:hypothetical protein P692DRAFT_20751994 [Suillus brevipes Sb2]
MSDLFTVYCWIRGTGIEQHFGVKISRSETVDTLKTLLKASQAIDVPTSALRLYKVRNPVPEPYHQNIRKIILSELGRPLAGSRKLSTLFKAAPPDEHIHMIVDAPQLLIRCWLRGSPWTQSFEISIESNASTGALKNEMKERESQLQSVDQSRIQLYRISDSEDELRESIDTLNSGHQLEETRSIPLFEYFLGVPVLEKLYVVVQVYSDNNSELIYYLIELH